MEKWQHLQPATISNKDLPEQFKENEVWKNDIYTVFVRRNIPMRGNEAIKMTWLSIKRNDKEAVTDWRHKQWIKNQLVGEKNEGCELYPSEDRLTDGSNQFHLWVFEDPECGFPFGFFDGRSVSRHPLSNGKQRGFPDNMLPPDIEESEKKINEQMKKLNIQ